MWAQKIEYVDVEVVLPPPVKKQVWDDETQSFVPLILYKHKGIPTIDELVWLQTTYNHRGVYKNGCYWDYSNAGNFTVMDEKVYVWYQMKWRNR